MTVPGELRLVDDVAGAFSAAVVAAFQNRSGDPFSIALSGGQTARACYERLAADAHSLDWWKIDVYWGDERCVPHDDPDSNYLLAREALLDRVGAANATHLMRCAEGPDPYQLRLGELGHLDVVHLGLGPDGHTASLFPGTTALGERRRWVVANHVPKFKADRITLTYPILNRSAHVVFLAAGGDKTSVLREVLEGPPALERLPSQGIRPDAGELVWLVDRAAAAQLTKSSG